jgi:tight adherence protein C
VLAQLDSIASADGVTPLIAILMLTALGLTMIFSSSGEQTKTMSKRIDKLQGIYGESGQTKADKRPRPGGRVTSQPEMGITEAEYRQLMRGYARLGVPAEHAYRYYQLTRLLLMASLTGLAFLFSKELFAKFFAAGLLALALPAMIGWFLPAIYLRRSIAKRFKAVATGLPDALELLAVCIEAGLSLENGLQRVSAELKRSQPELADELALTWAEINILPNRDQALLNLAERVDTPSVRSVVSTLAQTLRYGTPLARSLRVVAADVRADQLTAMEEKANRLPAMMTVPVMLFIMPTIFLIIGGPAALKLMDIFFK